MQTLLWMSIVLMALLTLATLTQARVRCCRPNRSFINAFLSEHNKLRSQLGKLAWDARLAIGARHWSSKCQFRHSHGKFGENLAVSWPYNKNCAGVARQHSRMWIKEIVNVNKDGSWACIMNSGKDTCGHYSQMVWKNTRRLGCATCSCKNLPNYTVCRYDPPGNYRGQKPY